MDDQFAIVHALLSEAIELRGIIAAHFGQRRTPYSEQESYDEILYLIELMRIRPEAPVVHGGGHALPDARTPVDSAGARLVIEEAMKDAPRPLHLAFLGPLTDMASALLMASETQRRSIRVIWIGGRNWPCGGWEYNTRFNIDAPNRPTGYRILGDSPAVGVVLYEDCCAYDWLPAPELDEQMRYVHTGKNRPIRVYRSINDRFILEDCFALLQLFHQS